MILKRFRSSVFFFIVLGLCLPFSTFHIQAQNKTKDLSLLCNGSRFRMILKVRINRFRF